MFPTVPPPSRVRAWLVLSRGSNLPTVWSNCLGGWWLGGGRFGAEWEGMGRLGLLLVGTSALYTAGMWLNDAYDSEFDARFRSERPIPAGVLRRPTVIRAGVAAVLAGWICLLPLGATTALWTFALTGCIELYDRVHKRLAHASWLMAGCRFLLYPLAASVSARGMVWPAVAAGAVLAIYVAGVAYLARVESLPDAQVPRWPWLLCVPFVGRLLTAPIQLAAVGGWLMVWPFAFWLWRAWRQTIWRQRGAARRPPPVADLLAGIVLVDLLLTPWPTWNRLLTFAALFVAARLFQRVVPAT